MSAASDEKGTSAERPQRTGALARTAAGLTLLATMAGAVALTLTHVETICRSLAGMRLNVCGVAPAANGGRPAPEPAALPSVPPADTARPAFSSPIFVAVPESANGPFLAAQARRILAGQGFVLADTPGDAQLRVELSPPAFGSPRAAPPGAPPLVSVEAVLEARLSGSDTPPASVLRREVTGLGATEAEARQDAMRRGADQIALRVAEALRQGAVR